MSLSLKLCKLHAIIYIYLYKKAVIIIMFMFPKKRQIFYLLLSQNKTNKIDIRVHSLTVEQ